MKNMLLAASFRGIRYLIINNMRSVHVVKVLHLYCVPACLVNHIQIRERGCNCSSIIFMYTVVPRRYAHPKKSYLRCKSGGGHDNEDAQ